MEECTCRFIALSTRHGEQGLNIGGTEARTREAYLLRMQRASRPPARAQPHLRPTQRRDTALPPYRTSLRSRTRARARLRQLRICMRAIAV